MALTQTRTQIRANVRRLTDTGGTNALERHPDADLNDYIDRALGSLHRALSEYMPEQRYLSSTTVSLTEADGSTYALPAAFDHLISVDLTANGHKSWLTAFGASEEAALTSPDVTSNGVPFMYRLLGSNIEYLPAPAGSYSSTVWYVPTPTQFTDDADTFDTINRLDDYLVAYASRFVAIKDKTSQLVSLCDEMLGELRGEISLVARNRDRNSPPRVVDESRANRWGRRPRGWRR